MGLEVEDRGESWILVLWDMEVLVELRSLVKALEKSLRLDTCLLCADKS